MRERITIEVRNTAEEKPNQEHTTGGAVFVKLNGKWSLVAYTFVTLHPEAYPEWAPANDICAEAAYCETAKRMPTEADADPLDAVLVWRRFPDCWIVRNWQDAKAFNLWQPMPAAPVPEKTTCERAFEAKWEHFTYRKLHHDRQSAFEMFQAGYEAARKEQP